MKALTIMADAVFLTRPVLLIPVWGFSILGYCRAGSLQQGRISILNVSPADLRAFGLMVCFSLTVAVVYVLNQLADRTVDAVNPGFALMGAGRIPPSLGWSVAAVLATGSLAALVLLDTRLALAGVVSIVIGLLYSFKPTALSGRPVADFLANAFGYGTVAFGAGWVLAPGHGNAVDCAIASIPYMLLMCAGSISSTIPDMAGDAQQGKQTTAVCLGAGRAHILATAFLGLAAVAGAVERDWVAMVCAGCTMPLYISYLFIKNQKLQESTYKIGGAVVMVAAVVLVPWLVPPAIMTVVLTYVYFRIRFGVAYPSLLPAGPATKPK